jgi:hypothetical protein
MPISGGVAVRSRNNALQPPSNPPGRHVARLGTHTKAGNHGTAQTYNTAISTKHQPRLRLPHFCLKHTYAPEAPAVLAQALSRLPRSRVRTRSSTSLGLSWRPWPYAAMSDWPASRSWRFLGVLLIILPHMGNIIHVIPRRRGRLYAVSNGRQASPS